MPEVGEIKQRYYKESRQYIWVRCPSCQEKRWMQLRNYKRGGETGLCLKCCNKSRRGGKPETKPRQSYKGQNYPRIIKNGIKDKMGYILVRLQPDDFFYPMVGKDGYVREHRLVMARFLGRCLHLWEIVHHKNKIRHDNRLENLQLTSLDIHNSFTRMQQRIDYLQGLLAKHNIKY